MLSDSTWFFGAMLYTFISTENLVNFLRTFFGQLAQLVRALLLHSRCRRFESVIVHNALMAELADAYALGAYGKPWGFDSL